MAHFQEKMSTETNWKSEKFSIVTMATEPMEVYTYTITHCSEHSSGCSMHFMYALIRQRSSWFVQEVALELQIRGSTEDNSKIIFLISQRKHIL